MVSSPAVQVADPSARWYARSDGQLSGEVSSVPLRRRSEGPQCVGAYLHHGARVWLTAPQTDAGYLTRKLVDGAGRDHHDSNCNTVNGIEVEAVEEGDETLIPLRTRVLGRTALYDIRHPATGDVLVASNAEIDETACKALEDAGIERVWIRSGLTCDAPYGMCAKCYGRDLSSGKPVEIGTAVGIIAAQSIGEPGTQLTMRTFHIEARCRRCRGSRNRAQARRFNQVC